MMETKEQFRLRRNREKAKRFRAKTIGDEAKYYRGHICFYLGEFMVFRKYYNSKGHRQSVIDEFKNLCKKDFVIEFSPIESPTSKKPIIFYF